MRLLLFLLLIGITSASVHAQRWGIKIDTVFSTAQLESLIKSHRDTLHIYLMPGDYHLKPKAGIDSVLFDSSAVFSDTAKMAAYSRLTMPDSMGFVDSSNTAYIMDSLGSVRYTYGLRISKSVITITGSPSYASAIYTHSGYGILFDGCKDASIEGLVITGGIRDPDGHATDAAIVVVNSKVKITNNIIFANEGDSALLRKNRVGIMGICAREGAQVIVFNNQIARNSWDGIGVYKDAFATITGNLIDGVDKSPENKTGGGRGIGIMVTRNGKATIETNVIKRYNKGIGIFINADVLVSGNLIEDIGIWGINVWDGDTGKPVARIEKNVVFKTGACGIAIIRYLEDGRDPGFCKDNIIVETGLDHAYDAPNKYCYQCALAVHGRPEAFVIENNVFYKNTWVAPCYTNLDEPVYKFIEILQTRFSTLPLQWYAGYSEFIQRFYFYVEQ